MATKGGGQMRPHARAVADSGIQPWTPVVDSWFNDMATAFPRRAGPRAEYQEQQRQRVNKSSTLAERFPRLKSLTVILEHFNAEMTNRRSALKYTVNLKNAKSVFRFRCPNNDCIRGDFDLSQAVAEAVARHRTTVEGEMSCRGNTIERVRCTNTLHYKLLLRY
jgi:hypothetical protein